MPLASGLLIIPLAITDDFVSDARIPRANTGDGTAANPSDISRGIYGATVGVDRLLSFLDRHHIKATWFVPAHSLQSFPKQVAKIRDDGHEM